jgi:CDP-6-deoxy-D-xylo-4-hexulose-3-dehydrase
MSSRIEATDLVAMREEILNLVERFSVLSTADKSFQPGVDVIPPSGKVIGAPELRAMVDASLDGWLTTGRFNDEFQEKLAAFLGRKHVLTVNSGSSANLVAFATLTSPKLKDKAIKPGDEVITVAAGFPTTVNPIIQCGAVPVFVDVDLETLNIDVSLIEQAITDKTKAVMVAHTLGNPFNAPAIREICDRNGLFMVEDCCDALGSTIDGQMVGTLGDIGTLSFYPAHHITMGEGGVVFTDDPKLNRIAESFRDWGRDCYCRPGVDNSCKKRFGWSLGELPRGYDHKYTYSHLGYNLKITDMQAACGLAQLDRLPGFVQARKDNYRYLAAGLGSVPGITVISPTESSDPSWFGLPLMVSQGATVSRNEIVKSLNEVGVGTRLVFAGNLTKQPYMKGQSYRVASTLDNTDRVMNDAFWVATYPGLDQVKMDYMIGEIKKALLG